MYELIKVAEKTYYMDCPAKVGFYEIGGGCVVAIDSGSDKDAAKKVKKILDAQGWTLTAIYNTHSHADHIGGNQYLQNLTGCKIFAPGVERCFVGYPVLEPDVLYGGRSPEDLHGKFLMAKESCAEELTDECLPEGLEAISLPGHSYAMVGYRTGDGVVFLADSLSSEETIDKYKIGYLYDVKAYIETLEKVKEMQADCFVPSHAEATADIAPLAERNIEATKAVAGRIAELLAEPKTFDELIGEIFDGYGLALSLSQYALVGSTVRSYLSYLKEEGKVAFSFEGNRMTWRAV